MENMTIGERLQYSTVKLSTRKDHNDIGTGTGFFFGFCQNGEIVVPAIITNKHVVESADEIVAICHVKRDGKPSGEFARFTIANNTRNVIPHPDPNVDLCAILTGELLNEAKDSSVDIYYFELRLSNLPSNVDWNYFDAMEKVTMLGCPNGISDEANNLPIARQGITATQLSKNYNGRQEFVVDMACFPGSSGSPIFIYDRDGYLDRRTNRYVMGQTRLFLVGILYAGPLITTNGSIILGSTKSFTTSSMMHLGYAIKSSEIIGLEKVISKILEGIISQTNPQ